MDKRAQISGILGRMLKETGKPFFTAQVVSVKGNVCTVAYDDLQISDVRLTATTTGGKDTVLITPAKDSFVVVGSHTGDLHNLTVLSVDAAEKIEIVCEETSVFLDKNGIVFNGGDLEGMIISGEMSSWMNKVYTDLTTLSTLLTAIPVTAGGTLGKVQFSPSTKAPDAQKLINKKVKQ